jgi:hypothetical protein
VKAVFVLFVLAVSVASRANVLPARLATIEKADADYLTELEKIRLDFHRKSWALSIHDKRTCKAQGFKWHRAGASRMVYGHDGLSPTFPFPLVRLCLLDLLLLPPLLDFLF